jgi:glycosyltransferase involved in cell wall biosynthesis
MKVAHIFITMPVGGAEDFAFSISHNASPDTKIEIVCLRDLGVAGESAMKDGLRITLFPILKGKRFDPVAVWKLSRWLKKQSVEVVHSQVYNAHIYAVLSAWLAGIPSVMHHQKTFNRSRRRRWWLMRFLARLASIQITLSEQSRSDVMNALSIPKRKTFVLPNFVDENVYKSCNNLSELRLNLGLSVSVPLIGGIASLNVQKNHAATIRMMASLVAKIPAARGIIFGEGPLRSELEDQIKLNRLSEILTLAGNKRPIVPWLQSLDIMVLPSSWEGQPMVILQAISCCIPVVCSNIEGNTAVLGKDHPGLFDLNNESDYLEKVYLCLNDFNFRISLIKYQERIIAYRPTFNDFIKKLDDVYLNAQINR